MAATVVGYAGGTSEAPTYRSIGDHTEALLVAFDKTKTTYEKLMEVFWESHDPRQTPYSRQYRNAVFANGPAQLKKAQASREALEKSLGKKVNTAVEESGPFYPAEDYHQKYYLKRRPDLEREVRKLYPDEAAFTASTLAARLNGIVGGHGNPGEALRLIEEEKGRRSVR